MKVYRFVCESCGYVPQEPGQLIHCDNVEEGPWYCPKCNKPLEKMEVRMISENAILDRLKEKGIITEEQLKELAMEGVDDTMNACAELMHTLLCRREHEYNPEMLPLRNMKCFWYAEQTLGTCWQEPEHKHWLNCCADEMVRQEFKSPKELHDFLIVAAKATGEVHFLKSRWPNSGEFLKELL